MWSPGRHAGTRRAQGAAAPGVDRAPRPPRRSVAIDDYSVESIEATTLHDDRVFGSA